MEVVDLFKIKRQFLHLDPDQATQYGSKIRIRIRNPSWKINFSFVLFVGQADRLATAGAGAALHRNTASWVTYLFTIQNFTIHRLNVEITSTGIFLLYMPSRPRESLVKRVYVSKWGIWLKESNARCRYLKKFTCKGILRQVFICLRPLSLLWPHIPPPPFYKL